MISFSVFRGNQLMGHLHQGVALQHVCEEGIVFCCTVTDVSMLEALIERVHLPD